MFASHSIDHLLASYPRTRPALPASQAAVYLDDYKTTRTAGRAMPLMSRITSRFNHWMHFQVMVAGTATPTILEIGAGTLNHCPFEADNSVYHVIEPFEYLLQGQNNVPRIAGFYRDIRGVPPTAQFDRIFSVAVLEHLAELPFVVAASALKLKKDGCFAAGIPTEGALMWGALWRLTTGLAYYLRHGFSKAPLMAHEHINRAAEIESIVGYFFNHVRVRRFPLPLYHGSIYTSLVAREPDMAKCQAYADAYLARHPQPFEIIDAKFKAELPRIAYAD